MKTKKKRVRDVMEILIMGIIFFIVMSVINKLFLFNSNWILISSVCTVAWIAGSIALRMLRHYDIKRRWRDIILSAILCFFIGAFVIGVILNVANWCALTLLVTLAFEAPIVTL